MNSELVKGIRHFLLEKRQPVELFVRISHTNDEESVWGALGKLECYPLNNVGLQSLAEMDIERWCMRCSECGKVLPVIAVLPDAAVCCLECYNNLDEWCYEEQERARREVGRLSDEVRYWRQRGEERDRFF